MKNTSKKIWMKTATTHKSVRITITGKNMENFKNMKNICRGNGLGKIHAITYPRVNPSSTGWSCWSGPKPCTVPDPDRFPLLLRPFCPSCMNISQNQDETFPVGFSTRATPLLTTKFFQNPNLELQPAWSALLALLFNLWDLSSSPSTASPRRHAPCLP